MTMDTHKSTSSRGFRILPLLSLTLALAIPAAADCVNQSFSLDIPDTATLKLPDGGHVIAAVGTRFGKLEARVAVKTKVVSEPQFYLGGKLLRAVQESQLSPAARRCLQNRAELSPAGWLATVARSISDFIVPTVHARGRTCIFKVVHTEGSAAEGNLTYVVHNSCNGRYYVI